MLDLWRFPSLFGVLMRRNLVQSVAVFLLALHGLIAVAGSAGLHVLTGCTHGHDAESCSHEHETAFLSHCGGAHEAKHHAGSSAHGDSCLGDSHSCPICHWWYTSGQQIVVISNEVCVDLQPLTGVVGDFGILLPRPDHRESFPRGPPPVLSVA